MSEEARYRAAAAVDPASPGAAARLLDYLADPSWRVRSAAAERLGRLPDPAEALPGLVEALGSRSEPVVRWAADTALVSMGAAVLPALRSILPGSPADVRCALVEVLGEMGDRRASQALEERLADPDENVRAAAAEGLGKVGGAAASRALLEALGSTEMPLVLAALEALERLGVAPPLDRLRPLLGDHLLGRPARRLLGFSSDPAALDLLARSLVAGPQSGRQACLAAVARQRMRRPAAALAPLAQAIRGAMPASAGWLMDALDSEVRGVVAGAVQVLGWLGDPAPAAAVAAVAADEELCPLVIEALEAMGPAVGPVLAKDLERLEPEVRMVALGALAQGGDAGALAALADAAGGQDEPERTAAFAALARIGGVAAVAPLASLLDHADQETVVAAVMGGNEPVGSMTPEDFRLLADLVRGHCGIQLREEMRFLVERRIGARVRALGLPDFGAYHRYLRHDSARRAELETAVELLATHETYLFREPLQLRAFSREVLPELAERRAGERRLHIWSAGCSTGEEAYTAAILLKETGLFEGWEVRIFGSDIARRALAVARTGAYGSHAFRNPEAEAIRRWFRREGDRWVVIDAVRRMVSFGHVNLLDPAATGLVAQADLIFCRNVLIYFDLPERRRVARLFHEKLADGGYLLLGHAETLLDVSADFELVQLRNDLVYRKPAAAP